MTQWRWRPEPWWLLLALLGAAIGAVAGSLVLSGFGVIDGMVNGTDPLAGADVLLVAGGFFGFVAGLASGAVAGVLLMFVVGRDRPLRSARPLAAVGAALTAGLVTWSLYGRMFGADERPLGLTAVAAATVAAAGGAWWLAGRMPDRPRVASGRL